ncbi:SLC13 family permease [Shewanella youngdeokensis]|uniref:SLC13 family permease n=1 Tax=Shewanella youngdeokensis TaxID=2999068 RepID=A0ABZ0K2W4_9GAMM|nr:SLC13 family permease [Shewanella sp. DAU334]
MSIDAYLTLGVFAVTIIALIRFQARTAAIFGLVLLSLVLFKLVSTEQLLASIANPGLVTLILLIMCSFALEKTRLLRLIASKVIVKSYQSTWLRLFGVTAICSAFLNNTAVVATLLSPIRNNPHHKASKLLLPLSYAAILGGTLTLVGTSTNLIVNSMYIDITGSSLSFFSFTAIGLCLVFGCGVVLWLCSRWLPEIHTENSNVKGYFIDAEVMPNSELVGRTVEQNGLRHLESLFLIELVREGHLITPVAPSEMLQEGDRLIFSGDITKVLQLSQFSGLSLFAEQNGLLKSNLTEVVVKPESILVGASLKTAGFRALFDAAVVAIKRDGEKISGKLGEVDIRAGDFLVLAVGEDFKGRRNITKNFIIVSGVEPDTRINGFKAWLSVAGFIGVVGLSAFGIVELLEGMLLFLGLLIFSKCLTVSELIRRFPADIWLIVSAAILLSHALNNSGVVDSLSVLVNHNTGAEHIYLALIMVYIATWLLTELVTNNAAAALMFPVAYGIAIGFDVNIMPFVMVVAFAASGSFISPYGYQTNLMVFSAGHYQLKDFVRVGLPVSLAYASIALTTVPIFFPF